MLRLRLSSRLRHALVVAGLAVILPDAASAQGSTKEAVVPEGGRITVLTPGIRVGNMVYASGQLGYRRNDADSSIQAETRRALEATQRVFEAAGTSMANAVKCTVFLVETADFGGMNEAYRTFFGEVPPARSTVVIKALVVPGAKVEIECMAVIP